MTHNEADSDVSYFPTFGQLIKGISLSQEVNTGTTADNLSEGMGAWINGEYITGNGNDVNTAYLKGLTEGFNNAVENCSISYVYHTHIGDGSGGGCYTVPVYHRHSYDCPHHEEETGERRPCGCTSTDWTTGDDGYGNHRCGNCGHTPHSGSCGHTVNATKTVWDCGMDDENIIYYNLGCGKTEGVTIDSATLVFK